MSSQDRILAGDVGGTKTVMRLFEQRGEELQAAEEQIYRSRDHASLAEIVEAFLADVGGAAPERVCVGVAGPVIDGRVRTTNLPWEIGEEGLAAAAGAAKAKLLNDLEAAAYGMLFLPEQDVVVLNRGSRPPGRGNIAVIAAGTGLGQAILYWDGEQHHPIATEGGHGSFAPQSDREIGLLRFLREKQNGHVSWERVVSGPGLYDVYRYLREASGEPEPDWLSARCRDDDPSAAVSEAGLQGEDAVCREAVELFASLYGAEAGNMALHCMALGGVYIGGGIAPKLLPVLQDGTFVRSFVDKGRFSELLEGIPVLVSTNVQAPIIGCARYALRI
jgi:glucokinase